MNALTNANIQIVNDTNGVPLVAVLPYQYYLSLISSKEEPKEPTVPHNIVGAVLVDGVTPVRAWREYLGLTQEEVAQRMGISQPAYAKQEQSTSLRRTTREKIAHALGIHSTQLEF